MADEGALDILFSLLENRRFSPVQPGEVRECKEHELFVKQFCEQCDALVCPGCVARDHINHETKVKFIAEAGAINREDLLMVFERKRSRRAALEKELELLECEIRLQKERKREKQQQLIAEREVEETFQQARAKISQLR